MHAVGVVGVLGAVGWFALYRMSDTSRLAAADRTYLEESQAGQRAPTVADWKQLFRHRSMWGMILGAFCSGYAIWMCGTWRPAAFSYVVAAASSGVAAYGGELTVALFYISASMFLPSFAQSGKWTLVTVIAPQSYAASVSSIQNFGSYIGGTVSPVVTGLALAVGAGVMIDAALLYTLVVRDPIAVETAPLPGGTFAGSQAAAE